MWTIFFAAAWAASVSISSEIPIGIKVDGNVVTAGAKEILVDALEPGKHVIEAMNLSGNMIDVLEINIATPSDAIELSFLNRRLQRVLDAIDPNVLMDAGPKPMPEEDYAKLMNKLVKGSAKKKFKRLQPFVTEHWFTIRQVKSIAASWDKMGDRMAAAKMLAPKTIDPENAAAMDALFPSLAMRKEVHDAYGIP